MVITSGSDPNPARRLRARQGAKIRTHREFRKWTIAQLAARMCEQEGITITVAAISDWERGVSTPRPHHQVALAKALDTPWSSLFSLDDAAA